MNIFKNPTDISKLSRKDPAYPVVHEFIQRLMILADDMSQTWCPESEGYIVILESTDVGQNLGEVYDGLFEELPIEGVFKRSDFFVAVALYNNSYGHIFLVEDAPWIDGPIRQTLEENLDPVTVE